MSLQQITNKNLIAVNCDFTTKNEVITFLVDRLAAEGKLKDRDAFMQAVMDREALSETGVDSGIAIPHGKSEAVKEAAVAICRVNAPIADWESMEEDNQVTLIFLLAIPVAEAGSTHLDLLAELMTHAQDEAFLGRLMHAATVDEMYDALDVEKKDAAADPAKTYTHTVVAVTACPAGIAHTYMAAEALAKAGEEMGVKVYVEKQGANGVEDRHTRTPASGGRGHLCRGRGREGKRAL